VAQGNPGLHGGIIHKVPANDWNINKVPTKGNRLLEHVVMGNFESHLEMVDFPAMFDFFVPEGSPKNVIFTIWLFNVAKEAMAHRNR
jgi:hypothetical protein